MRQFQMGLAVALWQHGRQWLAASRIYFLFGRRGCRAAAVSIDKFDPGSGHRPRAFGKFGKRTASCAELEVPKAKQLRYLRE
jgi:hypothetical protein